MSRQLLSFRQPLHPEAAHRIPFRKVSDEYTTPVCRLHHRDLPRYGDEASWGAGVGIDPLPIALEPWRRSRRNSTLKEGSVTNVWVRPSMSATVRPLSDIEFEMLLRRMGVAFHGARVPTLFPRLAGQRNAFCARAFRTRVRPCQLRQGRTGLPAIGRAGTPARAYGRLGRHNEGGVGENVVMFKRPA